MSFDKLLNYDYSKIAYWMVFTAIVLMAAIVMIVIGVIWSKKASKHYRCFYGYKLAAAKENEEMWKYVNCLAGRIWIIIGMILLVLGGFIMLKCMHGYYEQITSNAVLLLLIEFFAIVGCHFYIRFRTKKFGTEKK